MTSTCLCREWGLQSLIVCNGTDLCPVCLERSCNVIAEGCSHEFCVKCALYLCSTSCYTSETFGPPGSIPCPLCRSGIVSFTRLHSSPIKELKSTPSLSFCNLCILHSRAIDPPATPCRSECACAPFPSAAIPTCYCDDGPCPNLEHQDDGAAQGQSPHRSQGLAGESGEFDDGRLERTSCSGIFWSRRSCHREHQCNSEINA